MTMYKYHRIHRLDPLLLPRCLQYRQQQNKAKKARKRQYESIATQQ
jgi:hypothetical protein